MKNAEEAAQAAEATKTNVEGRCQEVTRGYYDAPSVGDLDGDGDADAEDGGKSEPAAFRHLDRKGKRGYPATFFGGRNDNGHRAIFIDNEGTIRSTDFNGLLNRYSAGILGNGTVDQIEDAMGVTFAFWSETIDGLPIPPAPVITPPTPTKPRKKTRVEKARKLLLEALNQANLNGHKRRAGKLRKMLDVGPKK